MATAAPLSLQLQSSLHHAHEQLCDAEEQFDLLRHTVDGWSAWPLIRFEVSFMLAGLTFDHRSVVSRAKRVRRAVQDLPRLARLGPARHLIQTYSSGLVELDGDRYRDMWFDDVALPAGSTFKIETLNNPRFAVLSDQAHAPRDVSGAPFDICAAILRRVRPSRDVVDVAAQFSRVIRGPLNLPDVDEEWVARRLYRFSSLRSVYAALLRRVRPSYVLVVNASHHGLMAAAREHGAIVLELQHGIADRSHASYSWSASAARYRPMMPVPDRLLLYGEYWKGELSGSGFWGENLRVVGSPRLDRYRRKGRTRDQTPRRIVFTTQGLDRARVGVFLTQFLERLGNTVPCRLAIKLHPIYDVDKAPYLEAFRPFLDRVDVIGGDEWPSTFELLRDAHVHVSIASASHYDAVGLGIPTVILPFTSHEIVLPLHRAGHAWLARTPEDLATVVRLPQMPRLAPEIGEYYFQPGARANILRELDIEPSATDEGS